MITEEGNVYIKRNDNIKYVNFQFSEQDQNYH